MIDLFAVGLFSAGALLTALNVKEFHEKNLTGLWSTQALLFGFFVASLTSSVAAYWKALK